MSNVPELFGSLVFSDSVMKRSLPKETYRSFRALVDAGKRVPDDISIIGYDGLKIGSFYTPKLSTVCQSVELLARRSFMVLMDCTEHGGPARHLTVPFTLSNRESVRKLESD